MNPIEVSTQKYFLTSHAGGGLWSSADGAPIDPYCSTVAYASCGKIRKHGISACGLWDAV